MGALEVVQVTVLRLLRIFSKGPTMEEVEKLLICAGLSPKVSA